MQRATLKIVLSLVGAGVVGFGVFVLLEALLPGSTSTRSRRCALSLSAKLNDRDGRLCRAGHRDLRATVAYKEVI